MSFILGILIGLVIGGGVCCLYFRSKYVLKPVVPKPEPAPAPVAPVPPAAPPAAPKPPGQPSQLKASLKKLFKW